MGFIHCCIYLALSGFIFFLIGRLISFLPADHDSFSFRSFGFERNGEIYEKLGIKHWKDKLLDMSKIMPFAMPEKKVEFGYTSKEIKTLINETCIAELIHVVLIITGLYCLKLWHGIGGVIVYVLYIIFGNLPYILIQRYNRPKLKRLLLIVQRRERMCEGTPCTEHD